MIVNIRFGEFSIRILVSRSLVPVQSPWTFCFLTLTWFLSPLELVFNSAKNKKSAIKFAEMASVLEYIFWTQFLWTTWTIVKKIWTLGFVCANFWVRLFINFKETKWTRSYGGSGAIRRSSAVFCIAVDCPHAHRVRIWIGQLSPQSVNQALTSRHALHSLPPEETFYTHSALSCNVEPLLFSTVIARFTAISECVVRTKKRCARTG